MRLPDVGDKLFAQIAMADQAAFDALYTWTSGLLFAIALRILGDAPEAEDCLADLYADIWQNADEIRGQALPINAALASEMRARAMAWKARRTAHPAPIETPELSPLQPKPLASGDGLATALSTLTPAQALLIRRVILDGEDYADLAKASQVPQDTIQSSVRAAIAKLAIALEAPSAAAPEWVTAGETALCLRAREPDLPTGYVAFWSGHIAELIGAEISGIAPSSQLRRRLDARLFAESRETLWQQLWPYAVGGAAAAFLLWLALTSGVLSN